MIHINCLTLFFSLEIGFFFGDFFSVIALSLESRFVRRAEQKCFFLRPFYFFLSRDFSKCATLFCEALFSVNGPGPFEK